MSYMMWWAATGGSIFATIAGAFAHEPVAVGLGIAALIGFLFFIHPEDLS